MTFCDFQNSLPNNGFRKYDFLGHWRIGFLSDTLSDTPMIAYLTRPVNEAGGACVGSDSLG